MRRPSREPIRIDAARARDQLVGQCGLRAVTSPPGAAGVRALLAERRCIQLDPLDRVGTNADLVALARVDGIARGDVYRHLLPGHAFEHLAKERCLLPATALPRYRALDARWWRISEKHRRLLAEVVEAVLAEVRERGPVTPSDLTDHGAVDPVDWSGWKGTAKATTMALEVLWWRCDVVVCGRRRRAKVYDVPERALPDHAAPSREDFLRWALVERVEAAGLLAEATGPQWAMLGPARGAVADALVAEGALERVEIEGARRTYLAPAGFLDRRFPDDDGRMRLLGPLDPLLWDRRLVHHVFGFEYLWEVYKPAAQRRWGYYVVPLLHGGRLVGRLEGHVERDALVVDRLWREDGARFDDVAYRALLGRHEAALLGGDRLDDDADGALVDEEPDVAEAG